MWLTQPESALGNRVTAFTPPLASLLVLKCTPGKWGYFGVLQVSVSQLLLRRRFRRFYFFDRRRIFEIYVT